MIRSSSAGQVSPPIGRAAEGGGGERPRWGLADVGLGLLFVGVFVAAGLGLGYALTGAGVIAQAGEGELRVEAVMSWFGLQLGLGSWPFVVSRWKGRGPVADWGLHFRLVDLPLGLGTFIIAIGAAGLMAAIVAAIFGLGPDDVAGNTQALEAAQATAWIWVLVPFVVVIGPAAEELYFRGLTLRSIERRFGAVIAVVGSSTLFAAAHFGGSGAAQTAVVIAAVGAAGVTFAVVTVQVGRLWPAIIGHMLFNGLAAARALGAFDQVGAT